MEILTYGKEVQRQASEFLDKLDEIAYRKIQERSDEEGCGAVMAAVLFKPK